MPGQTAPAGAAAILTLGVTGLNNERLPKLLPVVPVVIPATPSTDDAYIYPGDAAVEVACTCRPLI